MMAKSKKTRCRSYLCNEIVLQILSRLPTKLLFRFRCSSKTWLSLLDENLMPSRTLPSNIIGFFRHQFNVSCSIYHFSYSSQCLPHSYYGFDGIIDTSLSFLPCYPPEIINSHNGLLLCRRLGASTDNYYVCNPATKRWAALPRLPGQSSYDYELLLIYNPRACSSHYKVIGIDKQWRHGHPANIYIFSSENQIQGWVKQQQSTHEHAMAIFRDSSVDRPCAPFCNGAFYMQIGDHHMIKYILETRTRSIIMFPEGHTGALTLGNLGGSICCARISDDEHLRIWTLVENDTSWVLRHDINLEGRHDIGVAAFHPSAEVVVIQSAEGVLWACSLNDATVVNVGGAKYDIAFPFKPCYTDVLKLEGSQWYTSNYFGQRTGGLDSIKDQTWSVDRQFVQDVIRMVNKERMWALRRGITIQGCHYFLRAHIHQLTKELDVAKMGIAEKDKFILSIKETFERLLKAFTPLQRKPGASSSQMPLQSQVPYLQQQGYYARQFYRQHPQQQIGDNPQLELQQQMHNGLVLAMERGVTDWDCYYSLRAQVERLTKELEMAKRQDSEKDIQIVAMEATLERLTEVWVLVQCNSAASSSQMPLQSQMLYLQQQGAYLQQDDHYSQQFYGQEELPLKPHIFYSRQQGLYHQQQQQQPQPQREDNLLQELEQLFQKIEHMLYQQKQN